MGFVVPAIRIAAGFAILVISMVVLGVEGKRLYIVENDTQQFSAIQFTDSRFEASIGGLTAPYHQEQPVRHAGNNLCIRNWRERRRVDNDRVKLDLKVGNQAAHFIEG